MKWISTAIIIFTIAVSVYARDPLEILDIRTRYQQVADKLARNELFVNEYTMNKTALAVPDLGYMVTTVRAYYDYSPTEIGVTKLYKIEVYEVYKGATVSTNFTEFVYDTAGKLIFCFKKYSMPNPADNVLRRYYFKGTQAIRIQEGDRILEASLPGYETYRKDILQEEAYWRKVMHFE